MPDHRTSGGYTTKNSNEETLKKTNTVDQSLATSSGKKVNAAGALLKNKHPELFFVAPRPGGFIRHVVSPHEDPSRTQLEEEDMPVSRTNVPQATSLSGSVTIKDILETNIRCPNISKLSKDEERNNMVRMCSVAISTVIMLAQHAYQDITLEHVKHTEEYFRGLKQVDGYPKNVGQLMQVLTNLKKTGQIVTPPSDEEDSEDETEDISIADLIN